MRQILKLKDRVPKESLPVEYLTTIQLAYQTAAHIWHHRPALNISEILTYRTNSRSIITYKIRFQRMLA